MNKLKMNELLEDLKIFKKLGTILSAESLELVNEFGSPSYFLNEVENDNKLASNITEFKKFVLKGNDRPEFIVRNQLEKGKFLYEELSNLIFDFLGKDYVQISMIEPNKNSRAFRNFDDMEHFNLVFKKVFSTKKSGNIKTIETEKCEKQIAVGDYSIKDENTCTIGIDYVFKNNLMYNGHSFENQNVLFYGFNIEENPFLLQLFDKYIPAKILNIIPIGDSKSFYDNVD